MTKTIDLMPEALKTPEGAKRANEAIESLNQANANCANLLLELVKMTSLGELETMLKKAGVLEDDLEALVDEIADCLDGRATACEEMLRAVGGHAPGKPSTRFRDELERMRP